MNEIPLEDLLKIKQIEKKINFTDLDETEKNVIVKYRFSFINKHKLIPRILFSMSTKKREDLNDIDIFLSVFIKFFMNIFL